MKKVIILSFFCVFPCFVHAQTAAGPIDPATSELANPATVTGATVTVTIPKAEYEALKKAAAENQRLLQRRNQLLAENEALAAEVAVWKQRLARVLRCQTIQEAIEELQSYSGNVESPNR